MARIRRDIERVLAARGSGPSVAVARTHELFSRAMWVLSAEPDIEIRIATVNQIETALVSERARVESR